MFDPAIIGVLGIGIMSAILLYTAFNLKDREHWPFQLLNLGFALIFMLMIPYIFSENSQTCDIVETNTTQTATVLGAVTTTSTASSYAEQCFTNTNQSPTTLITVEMGYILLALMYWGVRITLYVYEQLKDIRYDPNKVWYRGK